VTTVAGGERGRKKKTANKLQGVGFHHIPSSRPIKRSEEEIEVLFFNILDAKK
jgi:hypothetical protein